MSLFEPGLVYPSDSTGPYVDLEGEVVAVKGSALEDEDDYFARVRTPKGEFECVGKKPGPERGYRARIRVYRSGGGWYPDDIVISWWKPSSQSRYSHILKEN